MPKQLFQPYPTLFVVQNGCNACLSLSESCQGATGVSIDSFVIAPGLREYAIDHYEHFGALPEEYEIDGESVGLGSVGDLVIQGRDLWSLYSTLGIVETEQAPELMEG